MTTTPTPAERAQAKRLAYLHPCFSPGRVNAIAQALADVRAETVAEVTAKYEAVAEEPPYKVGDPDPTDIETPNCSRESNDYWCTLEPKHGGDWHIAGDGDEVCAIWPVVASQ